MAWIVGANPDRLMKAAQQIAPLTARLNDLSDMLNELLRQAARNSNSAVYHKLIALMPSLERCVLGASKAGSALSQRALKQPNTSAPKGLRKPTPEEGRLGRPEPKVILRQSGYDKDVEAFKVDLAKARSVDEARRIVSNHTGKLWDKATAEARAALLTTQQGGSSGSRGDDRPLYWARLAMLGELRQWTPGFALSNQDLGRLLTVAEQSSRGLHERQFPADSKIKRIFVTGFDPFGLASVPSRGNPSGAIATALDGYRFKVDGQEYQVETAILPVRYEDFTRGLVNKVFANHLAGPQKAHMVVTVSQGGSVFELEKFNGKWRNADPFPDNNDQLSGGTSANPVPIPGVSGPDFTTSSLPLTKMERASGMPFDVKIDDTSQDALTGRGSGGGFISNEITYRETDLNSDLKAAVPSGHVHTPALPQPTDPTFHKTRAEIVNQFVKILRDGVRK